MLHRGLRIVQASTHTQITAGPQRQRMAQRETRRRATAARAMPPAMLVWESSPPRRGACSHPCCQINALRLSHLQLLIIKFVVWSPKKTQKKLPTPKVRRRANRSS